MLTPVVAARVVYEWDWMRKALAKAIETDGRTPDQVLSALCSGDMQAWLLTGNEFGGVIVTAIGSVKDAVPARTGQWLMYAAGQVDGGPRERLRNYQRVVTALEANAKAQGCAENWVEGPRSEWGRALLPLGYQIMKSTPQTTEYRKVL